MHRGLRVHAVQPVVQQWLQSHPTNVEHQQYRERVFEQRLIAGRQMASEVVDREAVEYRSFSFVERLLWAAADTVKVQLAGVVHIFALSNQLEQARQEVEDLPDGLHLAFGSGVVLMEVLSSELAQRQLAHLLFNVRGHAARTGVQLHAGRPVPSENLVSVGNDSLHGLRVDGSEAHDDA